MAHLADTCRARGVDEATLKRFWHVLQSMTGYSFCKPHSASYAQVSYESAFLRAHYPAYHIAAVLSNGGGFYSAQAYVSEAMRMGLRVLGPDVNRSNPAWRAEGPGAIRVGLSAISGLTKAAIEAILSRRGKSYEGLEDFQERTGLHADDGRRLALVGALDSLAPGLNRPQILWCMGQLVRADRHAPTPTRPLALAGQPAARRALSAPVVVNGGLFDLPAERSVATTTRSVAAVAVLAAPSRSRVEPPRLPAYTLRQRQEAEYAALGFLPGGHPLSLYEENIRVGMERLRRRKSPLFITAARIGEYIGKSVTLLGWSVTAKIVETRHGDAMIFQSFEDHTSLCEAVLFPKEFQRFHRLLSVAQPLWVTGHVEAEFGVPTLQVMSVQMVNEA